MKSYWAIGLILVSSSALADDFDITMDVLEVDETFDEAIVNRIALPFDSDASAKGARAPGADAEAGPALDELDQFVNESMGASGAEGGNLSGVEGLDELPRIVDPGAALAGDN